MSQLSAPSNLVILGASGGIGQAAARALKAQGHNLWLASKPSERLEALGHELDSPTLAIDATSFDEVDACFEQAKAQLGELHGVVNCVGSVMLKPAHRTSLEDYQQCLALNLTSAFATTRAAAKSMSRQGASVVLISSAAATIGLPNHEIVAASKAAIEGLTRSAAATYAPRKLRFNAIAPGLVQTPATTSITEREAALKYSLAMHGLDRVGQPQDIASMIAWLLHPQNDWITGQIFHIDGGLSSLKVPR